MVCSSMVVPHHIIRQALQIIIGRFQGVCVNIQDHHIIQSQPSDFLQATGRAYWEDTLFETRQKTQGSSFTQILCFKSWMTWIKCASYRHLPPSGWNVLQWGRALGHWKRDSFIVTFMPKKCWVTGWVPQIYYYLVVTVNILQQLLS